ncbi:Gfo/Idh/MocA family oxidoreductase [Saccharopolyspora shandongensis]|uniref:Gfo/Idh/MocA family oxidoreductase n=1 Tax=Saccharopolyspora shandongensis TaxID=418495 RepID=UPI0033D6FFFC
MTTLRAGVIGLGAMGRNHARILRSLPGVELIAAVEPDRNARAGANGVEVLTDVSELLKLVPDLCVLATPTVTHTSLGLLLAEARIPTLIEKPLAHDESSASVLVDAFEHNDVLACVGHIERFNPALQHLRDRLANEELGEIYQIFTRRQGPFPARISDVGVIYDLATHDIDLTSWVMGAAYGSVAAKVAYKSGRTVEDLVSVVAELVDGTVATHLVNWLSPMKERVVVVCGDRGCFVADTLTADLSFYENGTQPSKWETLATFRGVSEGNMTRFAIPKPEPLETELRAFVEAVRGEDSPIVTLRDGLMTVSVAEALRRSAQCGAMVKVGEQ